MYIFQIIFNSILPFFSIDIGYLKINHVRLYKFNFLLEIYFACIYLYICTYIFNNLKDIRVD